MSSLSCLAFLVIVVVAVVTIIVAIIVVIVADSPSLLWSPYCAGSESLLLVLLVVVVAAIVPSFSSCICWGDHFGVVRGHVVFVTVVGIVTRE